MSAAGPVGDDDAGALLFLARGEDSLFLVESLGARVALINVL